MGSRRRAKARAAARRQRAAERSDDAPRAPATGEAGAAAGAQSEITLREFEGATRAPGSAADFGGRVLDLSGVEGGIELTVGDKTVSNCTIKSGPVYVTGLCEDGAMRFGLRFVDVTFQGSAAPASSGREHPARAASEEVAVTGMVLCGHGADGVVFDRCRFANAAARDCPRVVADDVEWKLFAGLCVRGVVDVQVEGCCFVDNSGPGVAAIHQDTAVAVKDSQFVRNDTAGAWAYDEAAIDLAACVLEAHSKYGVWATGRGYIRAAGTTIRGNPLGAYACHRGRVALEGCRVADNEAVGLWASEGGRLTANDVACSGSRVGGMASDGGSLRLTRSTFRENAPHCLGAVGRGAMIRGSDVELRKDWQSCVRARDGGRVLLKRCRASGGGAEEDGTATADNALPSTVFLKEIEFSS
ncbi:unnamed protein product [Pedinophyceae sp. YPF-701]|nr:unnamed protein product [Pedinophyceae sp. YPF-701]